VDARVLESNIEQIDAFVERDDIVTEPSKDCAIQATREEDCYLCRVMMSISRRRFESFADVLGAECHRLTQ
jgi:hypothetical protein